MARRSPSGPAVNAQLAPVVQYAPDPNGWAMVTALTRVAGRAINGTESAPVVVRTNTFNGTMPSPQHMIGLAPLGLARPVVPRSSTMDKERSQLFDDTAQRIFAERLKRQR
jgi:hypothetical protein